MITFSQIVCRVFDKVNESWESRRAQKIFGVILVLSFLVSIGLIELNRQGFLPEGLKTVIPVKHFVAIEYAFTLLLLIEVVSLVLSLSLSVSTSIGKQFELLSLVLLRNSFKEISHFDEPIIWEQIQGSLYSIVSSAIGALIIFVILGFYYRTQRHQPITDIEKDRNSFIISKKFIALMMLFVFVFLIIYDIYAYLINGHGEKIFESFYTLLIFTDILIMLISLRYGSSYRIAFRNSGFAVSTVIIRLALIAPIFTGSILGVGGALFILGIAFAYNFYTPSFYQREKEKNRC